MDGPAAPQPVRELLGELLGELDLAAPYELVEVCDAWLRRRVGARWSRLLLVDYSQTILEPVPESGSGPGERHVVAEGPAGLCYREQRVVGSTGAEGSDAVLFVPVTIRAERLGVLMVGLDHPVGGTVEDLLTDASRVLAHVLASARRYTDRFEMLRRRKDLGLAAEIQWELLPVLAYELPAFSIAGALEPAYDIGGDTFDYAVSSTRLTISITDAVGHGLRAALLGSLAVTAMRNARRSGEGVLAQAEAANQHLTEQFPGASFVTGQLMEIDVVSGEAVVINAGHPAPLLLRGGVVEEVELSPEPPLGLKTGPAYRLQRLGLRHGDRLLLLTDGIAEAHERGSPAFGLERVVELLLERRRLPPAEFVRHLTGEVQEFRGGDLSDDATAVCLDWH
ncbi:PP2C family protein-serine/threonine phosphatase [Pseudonocardia sp. GCM10023141]|uniref:PP2C family protein-serine/threonine phosphatase n=1 Tax=Pseudonocardia sp. GCM10023141 TaxID=3252653 RepID=UPI0036196FA6